LSHGCFFREEAKKPCDGAALSAGRLWRHVRALKESTSFFGKTPQSFVAEKSPLQERADLNHLV